MGSCKSCGLFICDCAAIRAGEDSRLSHRIDVEQDQDHTFWLGRHSLTDDAASILGHAAQIVSGDRAAQHGPKERNHQNIADHWNAYLGARLDRPLTSLDVALMMVELKIARTKAGAGITNRDNYVDMAGYAGCAGEIALNSTEKN